jgi:DNA repair protein RadD
MGDRVVIVLRPYQTQMLAEARVIMRSGVRRVLMVAPTGSGKRLTAVYTIARAVERGKRCAFLIHRQELLDQSVDTLRDAGIDFGIVKAGYRPNPSRPAQVASIQTLRRRVNGSRPFDFLFVDEAHHAAAAQWAKVIAAYPGAFVLGFTATPQRLDGKGLGAHFDAMVLGPSTRELIDAGHLADYRLFAPPAPDLAGVHTVAGDYNKGELGKAIDKPQIVGDVVAHYQRYAAGTQAICFAVNIAHSKHLAEAFNAAGISARHADGETPRRERGLILEDFSAGRFRVLCNVDILGEGLDVVGIETVIGARPTQSLSVCLQQWGRGLRVKPGGKMALILDHAGNSLRHGLPDDDREWSLEDTPRKGRKPAEVGVKICPECFCALPPPTRHCPECGHQFVADAEAPEHAEGELEAVDPSVVRFHQAREQGMAKTLEGLIAVGRARRYANPVGWARHVMAGRRKRERPAPAQGAPV